MMTDRDDKMVDTLLADVARQNASPDDVLMARVMADAARLQNAPRPARRPGLLAQLRDLLGGWPGIGGVALAGIAGLWVGVAPPVGFEVLASDLVGTSDGLSFVEDATLLFEEGLIDG